jgi:hypothetical protein
MLYKLLVAVKWQAVFLSCTWFYLQGFKAHLLGIFSFCSQQAASNPAHVPAYQVLTVA